ncbi:MAG: PD-(D/E)XK nuclease family protein [Candidatus Schekmanbacteria bacterium]|nr:PD-(D/E)XK nuclease family protein [Candidatus Schekmanbacteria bacterium]
MKRLQFLDWGATLPAQAAARLLSSYSAPGSFDLSHVLAVVPTEEAGRRLRQALAQSADRHGRAAVPPEVLTPEGLVARCSKDLAVAGRGESLALWMVLLRAENWDAADRLFGAQRRNRERAWLLATAEKLEEMRDLLGENGLLVADAARLLEDCDDPERWRDLAELDARHAEALAAHGKVDRNRALRKSESASRRPPTSPPTARGGRDAGGHGHVDVEQALPARVRQIALVAVPDPMPQALAVLEALSEHVAVDIYVHAPESLAQAFDAWGRPLTEVWRSRPIDLQESAIVLARDPLHQAECVARIMHDAALAPAATVIGAPDAEVRPYLAAQLASAGVATHDPAGLPLLREPSVSLVAHFANWLETDRFEALQQLLRHPELLARLAAEGLGVSLEALLAAADEVQQKHLPETVAELRACWTPRTAAERALVSVLDRLAAWEAPAAPVAPSAAGSLRAFLAWTFETRLLQGGTPESRRFIAAADALTELFERLDSGVTAALSLSRADWFALLRHLLERAHLYEERPAGAVDLAGWLELSWADASHVLLTGANDGRLPETLVGDPFLPDSARKRLGLRHNEQRRARDAYLLSSLLSCRSGSGSITIILGKSTREGEPLRPSRLLFHCADESLAERARYLFSAPDKPEPEPPRTVCWRLQPRRASAASTAATISVTALQEYLSCPFRYYLRRVLRMRPVDPAKCELDALEFGTLCHHALEELGRNASLSSCDDGATLAAALTRAARTQFHGRYGTSLSPPLALQLDAAEQRLRAAAAEQARQAREGWRIEGVEVELAVELCGFRITGTIDRVDRHSDGRLRLIDYKTSAHPRRPEEAHLRPRRSSDPPWRLFSGGGREQAWSALQLPIYGLFARECYGVEPLLGYFNLPAAVTETGIATWTEASAELLEAAVGCASGALAAIRDGVFWPPAADVAAFELDEIYLGDAVGAVDGAWMAALQGASAALP